VSRSYRAFPSSQVSIVGWVNELDVLKSKEKPKKLTMLGSDGATYSFLCKREVKGDMRKNSRMMEFASVVNRLLREHADSRSRQLALRTFSVLPMSEECGLIEWVPNTTGFRHLVKQVHDENDILTCFSTIKRMYDEHAQIIPASIDNEIRLYQRLCEMYRPVFHKYFLTQFPEPSAWFQSRLKFARSAAVWSMVGYVVGLGDRHGENILIDEASGDCVHVDFDCLFGKGLTLEKPERVPFRLTPNMVDALGLSGVEGLFAAACEGSMHVMRANQQTVMSVLHTFIYDPLVEWKAATTGTAPAFNPAHAMGSSVQSLAAQGAAHGTAFNPNAIKILDEIEMKLRGQVAKESLPLSVHGQVAALIKDATSLANLAQMYIGWMAWL
jgi:serine/threonine-protein kinase ATR